MSVNTILKGSIPFEVIRVLHVSLIDFIVAQERNAESPKMLCLSGNPGTIELDFSNTFCDTWLSLLFHYLFTIFFSDVVPHTVLILSYFEEVKSVSYNPHSVSREIGAVSPENFSVIQSSPVLVYWSNVDNDFETI